MENKTNENETEFDQLVSRLQTSISFDNDKDVVVKALAHIWHKTADFTEISSVIQSIYELFPDGMPVNVLLPSLQYFTVNMLIFHAKENQLFNSLLHNIQITHQNFVLKMIHLCNNDPEFKAKHFKEICVELNSEKENAIPNTLKPTLKGILGI